MIFSAGASVGGAGLSGCSSGFVLPELSVSGRGTVNPGAGVSQPDNRHRERSMVRILIYLVVKFYIHTFQACLAGDCPGLSRKKREEVVAPIRRDNESALLILCLEDIHI